MKTADILAQLRAVATPARRTSPTTWTRTYHPGPDFTGFAGHFPGRPVLPALVQLVMVRLLVEEVCAGPCVLEVANAKFTSPILPGETVLVELQATSPLPDPDRPAGGDGGQPLPAFRVRLLVSGQEDASPRPAASLSLRARSARA